MTKTERKLSYAETHGTGNLLVTILLVLGILVEILYLTKDVSIRLDLTEEGLYSLSPSTKKVLNKLEQPLVIEAYLSKKIPGFMVEERKKIRNLLDEYKQAGRGKVKLVFLDPLEDQTIRDKAARLGIQASQMPDVSSGSFSVMEVWQGLRMTYGGDKQYVVQVIPNASALESTLTPKIQELVLGRRPKIAILSRKTQPAPTNPFMAQQQRGGPGWDLVQRPMQGRFDIVQMDVSDGKLLPEDLDLLVLIEPKKLTDWEKYCIDQHVMRGGNLLVLEDVADYQVDNFGSFMRNSFDLDAADSAYKWKDQLAAYGVEASGKLVADLLQQAMLPYYKIGYQMGQPTLAGIVPYPYWFRILPVDWSEYASKLVDDPSAAPELAKRLGPSIDPKHPVLEGLQKIRVFWPTEVNLAEKLPEGVEGKVLLRSSALGLVEDPPQSAVPDAPGFFKGLADRLKNEPKRQIPLMVALKGKFPSFFKGKPMPERPGQEKESDENGGLLQGTETGGDAPAAQDSGGKTGKSGTAGDQAGEKAGDQAGEKPDANAAPQGPPAPEGGAGEQAEKGGKDELPARIDQGEKECRVVVVGDSSFIRDDFLQGVGPARQPNSGQGGPALFMNLLDWLTMDLDLVELRTQRTVDRTMTYVSQDFLGESQEEYKERVAAKKTLLRFLNVLGPVILLVAFGFLTWSKRIGEKRRFLAEVQADLDKREVVKGGAK